MIIDVITKKLGTSALRLTTDWHAKIELTWNFQRRGTLENKGNDRLGTQGTQVVWCTKSSQMRNKRNSRKDPESKRRRRCYKNSTDLTRWGTQNSPPTPDPTREQLKRDTDGLSEQVLN